MAATASCSLCAPAVSRRARSTIIGASRWVIGVARRKRAASAGSDATGNGAWLWIGISETSVSTTTFLTISSGVVGRSHRSVSTEFPTVSTVTEAWTGRVEYPTSSLTTVWRQVVEPNDGVRYDVRLIQSVPGAGS